MRRQPACFTDDTYHGDPGKDFDNRVRYDPLPGDVQWHGSMGFPPELSDPVVSLSGLLGEPVIQDATDDGPVDSVLPGECYHCRSKATHVKGNGEPVCRYHKQFFFTQLIREDETCG